MRLSPLLVPLVIAMPGALGNVLVTIKAEDSTLSIFGIDGPRETLGFLTTSDQQNPYKLAFADKNPTDSKLLPGNASFRHTSEGKHVDCSIEGIPSGDLDSNKDFSAYGGGTYATSWKLASLSDTAAQPCAEKGGMKLACKVFDDKDKPLPDIQQLCMRK